MKLTFLGTSHGIPSPTRYCMSIMLEVEENVYLFDAGAPVGDLLIRRGIPYHAVQAFFNTHAHGDHLVGIFEFIDLCNWYYGGTHTRFFLPQTNAVELLRQFSVVTENRELSDRLSVEKYTTGLVYEDEYITVTARPTDHLTDKEERRAYGFIVEEKKTGKRFVYAGDSNEPLDDVSSLVADGNIELLIVECAHFSWEVLFEKLMHTDVNRAAVVHIGGDHKFAQIEESRSALPMEVIVPADGDVIEV